MPDGNFLRCSGFISCHIWRGECRTCWETRGCSSHKNRTPILLTILLAQAAIHPSFHFQYTCFFSCSRRSKGGRTPSQLFYVLKEGFQMEKPPVYFRDKQPFTLTLVPRTNLPSPMCLTDTSLDCGRKPENLKRTHTGTVRASGLYAPTWIFLQWGNSRNRWNTMLPPTEATFPLDLELSET